jgi:hypothetical protein
LSKIPLPSIELQYLLLLNRLSNQFLNLQYLLHNKWQKQVNSFSLRNVIDGFLVSQLKTQLEMYRSHTDNVPKKSEINQMRKPALIDLLKMVAAQYKASQTGDMARNVQPTMQAGSSIIVDQDPARILDVSKITSSKTIKTVLKAQLELYRQCLSNMPISEQMEGMKKPELVNLLLDAVNHYTSSQSRELAGDL